MAKYTLLKPYKEFKTGEEIELVSVIDIDLLTANGYIASPLETKKAKPAKQEADV